MKSAANSRTRVISQSLQKGIAFLLPVTTTLGLATAAVAGGIARDFDIRYQVDQPGTIRIVGNSTMTCSNTVGSLEAFFIGTSDFAGNATNPSCTNARNRSGGVGPTGTTNNVNDTQDMVHVDVDGDPSTFSSSSSTFTLPDNATVTFAGLYWSGNTDVVADYRYYGSNSSFDFYIPPGEAAPNPSLRNQVKFKIDSGAYQTLTATQLDSDVDGAAGGTGGIYQGFVDVTSLVATQPSGSTRTYTVGDVQSAQGQRGYGSWSLVVVYEDTTAPLRNLTVYDGFIRQQDGDAPRSTTIDGFYTPITGAIRAEAGIVLYEGDLDLSGDQFLFNGSALSDTLNPSNDFWNSNATLFGSNISVLNPDHTNLFGTDINMINVSNFVTNGDSSAEIGFTTDGDQYYPGVFTFAIDIFRPELTRSFTKRVLDINGGIVLPGDEIEYEISYTNTGNDGASDVVLRDPIPAGSVFVPGSIEVVTDPDTANVGNKTDTAGDDEADYDAGTNEVVIRTGTGADETQGGLVDIGETVTVKFKVQIDPNFSTPDNLSNQAVINYNSGTTGQPFTGDSDNPDTPEEADPTTITVSDPPVIADVLLVKRITAINRGSATEQLFDTSFVDAGTPTDEDNEINWPGPAVSATIGSGTVESYIAGIIDGASAGVEVRPGDELEYTIPFLSNGNVAARDVLICDRIPENTTFVSNAFNDLAPPFTGGGDRGLFLSFNGNDVGLTNADDGDEFPNPADGLPGVGGYYFPAGVNPGAAFPGSNIDCGGANTNGAVVLDLSDVANSTGEGTPDNSYGFVRFRVTVD